MRNSVLTFVFVTLLSLSSFQPANAATLYAVGGGGPSFLNSGLWTVDPLTGAVTLVGGMSTGIGPFGSYLTIYNGGLTYDPHLDKLYALGCDGAAVSWLYQVNRANGNVIQSIVSPAPANNTGAFCSGGLAYDVQTHVLYAVGETNTGPGGTGLWTIDPNTGAGTFVGNAGATGMSVYGIGIDPQTGVLYGNGRSSHYTPPDGGWSSLITLDKGTGLGTFVGYHGLNLGGQMGYSGLAFDPASNTMYGLGSSSASQQKLYTVNKGTGQASPVGGPQAPNIGVAGALVFVGPDVVGVDDEAVARNPFRAQRKPSSGVILFSFSLERSADITITIVDVSGRNVARLKSGEREAGPHEISWNGRHNDSRIASGIYCARLTADGEAIGRTKVLIAR